MDWLTYLVGAGTLAVLAAGWVGVQTVWRRSFPHAFADPDVLAGRRGCGACSNADACEKKCEAADASAVPKEVS